MFSDELMRYLIKYQSNEFLTEEKDNQEHKNDEILLKFHRFTQFAAVPVRAER